MAFTGLRILQRLSKKNSYEINAKTKIPVITSGIFVVRSKASRETIPSLILDGEGANKFW